MRCFILRLMRALAGEVLPLLFWVMIIFGFDKADAAVLTILSALLHELGHIGAAIALKLDTGRLSAHISGFRIHNCCGGYKEELLVLLFGPLVNLTIFLLSVPFFGMCEGYIMLFGYINLVTAISNLLPVEGYDGYGILSHIFSLCGWFSGIRILGYVSFSITVVVTLFSLYLLLCFGEGYWIFGVFFTIMLTRLSGFIKNDVLRE